jgi:hypothetical protein
MKRLSKLLALCALSLSSLACGPLGMYGEKLNMSGGEIYEDYWEKALRQVRPRAEFDMRCPASQLHFEMLRTSGREAVEVGVIGCGVQAVYVRASYRGRVSDTWVQNSDSREVALPPQAQRTGY